MQLALIVDDSKTARLMLRRMLDKLNIPVEMVESGEEALEFLKSNRPDVIFMDHMMPGMDGFTAVKAIKSDPEKSSIPIVMHTTQQGDIYVGQARALGAMDILSKPTTDEQLIQVLDRIKSTPNQQADVVDLETDLAEGKSALQTDPSAPLDKRSYTLEIPALDYTAEENQPFIGGTTKLWLLALIWMIPIIFLFGLYLMQQKEINKLQDARSHLYKSMEWMANQQSGYDYGEVPLSDQRLELLSNLVLSLQRSGFKGVVQIEGHIGNFCLTQLSLDDGGDVLMLPQPELGLSECDVIGTSSSRAMDLSIEQSPSFRRFVQNINDEEGDISIRLVPYGSSSPSYLYPDDINSVSTGDWNAIAMNNNRVNFVFVEKK